MMHDLAHLSNNLIKDSIKVGVIVGVEFKNENKEELDCENDLTFKQSACISCSLGKIHCSPIYSKKDHKAT